MSPAHRIRLMALSEREFKREARTPAPIEPQRKFKPIKVNLAKLDSTWDRKRGAAVRMMAVVLRDDDASLTERVTSDGAAYTEAASWLRRESTYLEKTSRMMNTAAARLAAALARARSAPGQVTA